MGKDFYGLYFSLSIRCFNGMVTKQTAILSLCCYVLLSPP